ncbi:PREDICTED: ubiquitin/ISG15-conjugating enzyme E2 L6 [Condylura cristata]|uniref:ubiquitin/ISG15-conjugating enzyme E2 L6 n=1 Tax=Condylura cristata TaxID=143302 RepID=UPI000642C6B1|nr:PREDICTED: ubiquitin/ISG15-conjugating enzyme E2 L6 [Condylura cristata]
MCQVELEDLQKALPPYLRSLTSDDASVLVWHVLLLPERPPYNLKAFGLRLNFPNDYPFKPPKVTFTTQIYHPSVDVDGQVCLPLISSQDWTPSTKACQVLEVLNELVNSPERGEPLRLKLAEELEQDPGLFDENAREFTLRFGVDRPS